MRTVHVSLRCLLITQVLLLSAVASLSAGPGASSSLGFEETADLILTGGEIVTLAGEEIARVEAMATSGDRILALGASAEVLTLAGRETRIVDLAGATVIPGLVDAHLHLLSLGRHMSRLDLTGTRSFEEVLERTRRWIAEGRSDSWVVGRGWDQNDWEEKEFPDNRRLSSLAPDRPVYLTRVDGHAVLVNDAALELAGIRMETPDPAGGRIFRDREGRPTGILLDNAVELVRRAIPEASLEERKAFIRRGIEACVSLGLVGVHEPGLDAHELAAYLSLAREGELPLRVYALLDGEKEELLERWFAAGPDTDPSDHLVVRAVKLYADGALGSRGAALLAPYADDPENMGLLVTSASELGLHVDRATRAGFQVAVHAIGDRANRLVLDTVEGVMSTAEIERLRPRIEHAQVIDPADLPRFAGLGVIASMQPTHCTSDMPWAPDRLGSRRLRGAYAWRSLRDLGSRLAGGSDAPVESADPLLGIYAAVTRQDLKGHPPGGWRPRERLTPGEALDMFTRGAAYASFGEEEAGTLEPGKRADLTILSRNILDTPPGEIPAIRILATVVGGKAVYLAEDAPFSF